MTPIDEDRRRQFEAAWFAGRPEIDPFLPAQDDERFRGTLEELVLIDTEFRWKNFLSESAEFVGGNLPEDLRIERYLARFEHLREPEPLKRLISAEKELRCRFGNPPLPGEYRQRFPQLFADVESESEVDSPPHGERPSGVASGQRLGRYQLQRLHARGGFGEIWRAYDPVLKRQVAIKTLSRPLNQDEGLRRRFEAEARMTAQLEHPGIVSVHDSNGVDGEVLFYVMRMLEGETLAEAIQAFHACPEQQERALQRLRLLSAFMAVTQTVEFAHAQGTLHRDLKPQNIILGDFGETAILDWGIAKRTHVGPARQVEAKTPAAASPTQEPPSASQEPSSSTPSGRMTDPTLHGTVMGTPAYMSPEQAAGKTDEVDERSDQFSLGVILFEILTGNLPEFQTDDQRPGRGHSALRLVAAQVSRPLQAICLKAMAPNRDARYRSVSELKRDLQRYLADEPVSAYAEPLSRKVFRWVRRHRTLVSTAATTVVVAAILLSAGVLLLLEANRRLAAREQEAQRLRHRTQDALDAANRNLYSNFVALAHAEILKNNVVRAGQLLEECPEHLRNWEWSHLKWVIRRHEPAYRLEGVGYSVSELAFSPNRSLLAAAGMDGKVLVWDTNGWKRIAELDHGAQVRCLAFSPDGQRLASGGNILVGEQYHGNAVIWDVNSWEAFRKERIHRKFVSALSFTADGSRLVTGGNDRRLSVRDAVTLKSTRSIAGHTTTIGDLVVRAAPTDKDTSLLLSCATDGQLKIWNLDTGQELESIQAHAGDIPDCDLDPSGRLLATVGADRVIKIWDLEHWLRASVGNSPRTIALSPAQILAGHTDQVRCVAFSPRGDHVASGSLDRTVRVWNLATGAGVAEIRSHTSHVQSITFDASTDMLATAGDSGEVQVRRVSPGSRPGPTGRFVRYAPGSRRLLAASKSKLDFWQGSRRIAEGRTSGAEILTADISPDGQRCVVICAGGGMSILDTQTGAAIASTRERVPAGYCVAFTSDNQRIISGHVDKRLRIWDAVSADCIHTHELPGMPRRLAIPPGDQRLLVGYSRGAIGLWRMDDWQAEYEIPAHDRFLLGMALHPQEPMLATTGLDGRLKLWNWRDGSLIRSAEVGASWLNCLLFTPDGQRIVTGSEHTITFWDPRDLREVLSMSLARCVHEMSFTSDGQFLALAGEDPTIRIWRGGLRPTGGH